MAISSALAFQQVLSLRPAFLRCSPAALSPSHPLRRHRYPRHFTRPLRTVHISPLSMKNNWTPADISDLSGKVAIVTGSNIGLGLEIVKQLALHNASVVMAVRTPAKAETAKDETLKPALSAEQLDNVTVMKLDVSSYDSVHTFASEFIAAHDRLDILMCNAGVMALEKREVSADGNELQFATNHLGHFLLTGLLMDLMRSTEGSRVVTQSSSANWSGGFDFENLNADKSYSRWGQYSMTKLSNVTFANELNKRIADAGHPTPQAFSVHPGLIIGQLQEVQANGNAIYGMIYGFSRNFAGTYETGAVPALFACAAKPEDGLKVGEFYGPDGWFNGTLRGDHPKALTPNKLASDPDAMKTLWEKSEELTKFTYNLQ